MNICRWELYDHSLFLKPGVRPYLQVHICAYCETNICQVPGSGSASAIWNAAETNCRLWAALLCRFIFKHLADVFLVFLPPSGFSLTLQAALNTAR